MNNTNGSPSKVVIAANYFLVLSFFTVPLSTTVGQMTVTMALLLTLISGDWVSRFEYLKQNKLVWVVLGFICLIVIGCFYGPASWSITLKVASKYTWLLMLPLFLAVASPDILKKHAINAFLLAILLTLVLSYLKVFGVWHYSRFVAPTAVFKDRIVQSFLFSFAFVICLDRFFNGSKKKWTYAVFAILLVVNLLFFSDGRTAYLMLPLVGSYFCYAKFGVKWFLLSGLVFTMVISAALLVLPPIRERVVTGVETTYQFMKEPQAAVSDPSMGLRLQEWKTGLQKIREKMIMGYGTGGVSAVLPESGLLSDSAYLNILLQYGLVGLLYLFFFLGFVWRASQTLSFSYRMMIRSCLIAFFPLFFFNAWLSSITVREIFLLVMTLCFSEKKYAKT